MHGKLSENDESEEAISRGHPETDICCTDLSPIILFVFMPWNNFLSLFLAEGVALEIYKEFD